MHEINSSAVQAVTVNLRDVDFVDSRGLEALVALDQNARRRGLDVGFLLHPERTPRVFELTDIADGLTLVRAGG